MGVLTVERPKATPRRRAKSGTQKWQALWLLLPALLFYAGFFLVPTAMAFRLSFFDWDGFTSGMNFVGLANFQRMLGDTTVLRALAHTVVFFLAIAIFQSTVGLFIALQLNAKPRFYEIYRIIIFLPVTLSLINTAFMWQLMLSPKFGLINPLLRSIGLGFLARPWLADLNTALPTVITVQAWQWIGLPVVVFMAGLQSVRKDLIEAAAMEGAGRWASFRHVVWPQLAPAFTSITMLACIRMFRVFDIVYVLEGVQGSPVGNTSVLQTVIYGYAYGSAGSFSTVFELSYAMAIAVSSSILLLAIAIGLLVVLRRREMYL